MVVAVIMSMRKCCNHPYLFDNAEPTFDGEFVLGEHLVEARYRCSCVANGMRQWWLMQRA